MSNENEAFFRGINAAYLVMRQYDDMNGATEWLVRKLRQAADDLEAKRIHPDGTVVDIDVIER